jgi:hypothetical protein
VRQVFGDEVQVTTAQHGRMEVVISVGEKSAFGSGGDLTEVFRCSQRDLFRKYQWPAGPKIVSAMEGLRARLRKEAAASSAKSSANQ